jgi:hypothetical protein
MINAPLHCSPALPPYVRNKDTTAIALRVDVVAADVDPAGSDGGRGKVQPGPKTLPELPQN